MTLITWVALLLATHQIHALHIQNNRTNVSHKAIDGSANTVVIIMFDHSYKDLFQCFIRYFDKNFTVQIPLDVVVYDKASESFMRNFIAEHPGVVRELEAITEHKECLGQLWSNGTHSGFPPRIYTAHYWLVILERLQRGENVLHMDLDAIAVGDPLAPITHSNPNADIVAPGRATSIDQQYVLYRSTKIVQCVIKVFADAWDNWLRTETDQCTGQLPLPIDQDALIDYITKYNPEGCTSCTTHVGHNFLRGDVGTKVAQSGFCDYPDGCKQKGIEVVHGRRNLLHYCTKEEASDAMVHS